MDVIDDNMNFRQDGFGLSGNGHPYFYPNVANGVLGSFGQLMMNASIGTLYEPGANAFRMDVDITVGDSSGGEKDEYYADESDNSDGDGNTDDDSIDGTEDGCETEIANDVIWTLDDTIPSHRFQKRGGEDDTHVPWGEDDTENVFDQQIEPSEDYEAEKEHENPLSEPISPSCLGGCGCSENEVSQEISAEYIESLNSAYKKRSRGDAVTGVPDCRKPRDMGALEIAMRSAGQRGSKHIFEPILGIVFDSAEESYEFYNMYSWECGFGIIKNRCTRRQSDHEYRSMQELCCERSGSDPRVNGSTKKIKCKARLKLLRGKDGGWYVSEFVKEHNHPLADSCSEKREWYSHKRLDPYTLDVIRYLRKANVNQTKVRCIIGSMFGGLKSAPCTKRTLRSVCSQVAREQMDDDVAKTMEVFKQMKSSDPEFQWNVETDKDSRINTLMWCSGRSREQYACFGDVVTFDTTYCTNFYKMPFGLFVGVNNHFQTVVFGGVLMRTETTESFEWVFREFIKLMGGKEPKTVLTDQCKAMTIALGRVCPDTFHMWCKWHILKNIRESLGPTYTKNAAFRQEFYAIINEMMTKDEFNMAWDDLCLCYGLKDNPFMIRTFQCRSKWAKPWSKGNFCAGMTSTQCSESANWMLKRFVPRNSSMNQFVSQFNVLLEDREMEEGREENLTKQLYVKYSRLWPIERHAIKVYTRQSLRLFRKQVANFKVSGRGADFYIVERNREDKIEDWRKNSYKITEYGNGSRYFCECGYFEHVGILCCHTIRLMIRLEKNKIPDAHILTRWTRNAKDVIPSHMRFSSNKGDKNASISVWQRRLNTKALEACTKGNYCRETYDIIMNHMIAAIKEVDEFMLERKNMDDSESTHEDELEVPTDIDNARSNRYGASGSSAGMSDSDIQNLRAPNVEKKAGRARTTRFKSAGEKRMTTSSKRLGVKGKRVEKKKMVTTNKKRKCRNNGGGSEVDADFTGADENRGLPFQSSFCKRCKKPGHGQNKCPLQSNTSGTTKRCTKCELKGHDESECLVVDDDLNRYFR